MPKASRRKRLTRPPKWTRRPKPKELAAVPAEAAPEPAPFPVPDCPMVAPVAHTVAIAACPEEAETLPLPQPHNIPVPVDVPPEEFPSSDSDIPMLRNTDDLIQCLKDHLKKWKEP